MNSRLRPIVFYGLMVVSCILFSSPVTAQIRLDTAYATVGVRPFDEPINPDRYLIRPGERLEVTFIDVNLPGMVLNVNPEGQVVHSGLGVIDLSGMNLRQAREVLTRRLDSLFHADQIVISVGSIYPVVMQVFGMVNRPGVYVGYTSQRVREIIDSAGGIAEGGSRRRIHLRGGPKDIEVDLDLATYTDRTGFNPYLYGGKKVFVPELAQTPVTVMGEVVYSRAVEMLPGEGFAELVALVGGTRTGADTAAAFAVNDRSRNIHQPGGIHPGDQIFVPLSAAAAAAQEVVIAGAVEASGTRIAWDSSITVADLVSRAGGPTPAANSERLAVFRTAPMEMFTSTAIRRFPISVPPDQVQKFNLRPDDSVFMPLRMGFVEISGAVVRPGLYPHTSGLTAAELIAQAGGYIEVDGRPMLEVYDHVTGLTRPVMDRAPVSDGDRVNVMAPERER
ncbi:MAG: SLBB domain-containing protein [Candidatus Zixiibacteriota bacterium]